MLDKFYTMHCFSTGKISVYQRGTQFLQLPNVSPLPLKVKWSTPKLNCNSNTKFVSRHASLRLYSLVYFRLHTIENIVKIEHVNFSSPGV